MIRIRVLGGFRATGLGAPSIDSSEMSHRILQSASASPDEGTAAVLSDGTQRLVAFLALRTRPADRGAVAAQLWPDARDGRAASSLRSALARLGGEGRALVESTPAGLALRDDVQVDIRIARSTAARLLAPRVTEVREADITPDAVALFGAMLLPDWFDGWLEPAAEEWRHLRVNALEAQSDALLLSGRLHEAAAAARRAIDVDPLRETAQRRLIAVHLAAGNQSDALRDYAIYRARLHREVGLEPTAQLTGLIAGLRQRSTADRRFG